LQGFFSYSIFFGAFCTLHRHLLIHMSDKKLNVLFLSSWFPTRIIPTLGNFVQRHAEAAALQHNVTALIIQKDTSIQQYEVNDVVENGVRVIRVYYPNGNIFIQKRSAFKKGIKYLQQNGGFQFDLVQLNMVWKEGWQAVFLKKKYKIPFIISDNWTGYHLDQRGPLPWHIRFYMKWVGNNAALLIPVTQHLEHAMCKLGFSAPSMIVPNVVDTDVFQLKDSTGTALRFLHVSHLDNNHKNIKGILKIWKKYSSHKNNVHLEIGGDGDLNQVKSWAQELDIQPDSISFFGTQTPAEIAVRMQRSDALVLFSNYENLPLVMIEAMACGLQVIATNVGGISEHLINNPPHHLIAPRDEEALFTALERISKIDLTSKKKIREYAVKEFSKEVIASKFSTAYEAALKKSH
jgi:glycosyltransferase involved in cell wall biosynthesis